MKDEKPNHKKYPILISRQRWCAIMIKNLFVEQENVFAKKK